MRLWRSDGSALQLTAGEDPGWSPTRPARPGLSPTPGGVAWLEPVTGAVGLWLEVTGQNEQDLRAAAPRVLSLVAALLESERQRAHVAEELAGRYEEIELLYAISETLGRTVRLEEASQIIVREVSAVVGARRASIMVFDEATGTLRTVAARGFAPEGLNPVPVADDCSIAARVYRDRRTVTFDPEDPDSVPSECGGDRGYRGNSFLSVPITYAAPGTEVRCVGVMNLTDRIGGDRFTRD
ncbi:MAG TPA: GAF domain-containing protein, partial [Gemmatimonadales bacterium]|nr:GAF domain-containing protein [Gemmatimonadales bacterium]